MANSCPRFRAWHKDLKMMCNVCMIRFIGSDYVEVGVNWQANEKNYNFCGNEKCTSDCGQEFIISEKEGCWDTKYLELMQWTGMQDKNGVDIYEGDILTLGSTDNFFVEKIKCVYFLSFKVMKVQQGWIQHRKLMGDFCEKEFEVIGNIYSNPEFLNAST